MKTLRTKAMSCTVYWTLDGNALEVSPGGRSGEQYRVEEPDRFWGKLLEEVEANNGHGPMWGQPHLEEWAIRHNLKIQPISI